MDKRPKGSIVGDEPENGQLWYQPIWCLYATSQWLVDDTWILLSGPGPARGGGTCMMARSEKDGKVFYTRAELQERLEREGWQHIDARLVIDIGGRSVDGTVLT